MRISILLLAASLIPSTALAADTWTDPYPGVRRLHRVTSTQDINVLVVDLCAPGVSIRTTGTGERQRTVGSFGALVNAQAAINGDFFNYADYSTTGPAAHAGTKWGGSDGNFTSPAQFGDGQVALPLHTSTAGIQPWAREVVSGHPTIVAAGTKRDNSTYDLCTARHPRTALGFSADKTKLILAVVDGRATNRIGMTCDELGTLMLGLGARDAVNLDGGGSSTMWTASGGVLNNPSDGAQRVVANHLAIRATGNGEPAHCPVPRFAASPITMDAPLEMTSGEEAVVFLELRNDGRTEWDDVRVGTQGPQDRESAFYKAENWLSPNRPTAIDAAGAANGDTARFTWAMVAPEVSESTQFDETFQLVQEGVAWFGPEQTMSIMVHPRSGPTTPDPDDPDPPSDGGCSSSGATGWLIGLLALTVRRRRRW